jgi:hypothetical protein
MTDFDETVSAIDAALRNAQRTLEVRYFATEELLVSWIGKSCALHEALSTTDDPDRFKYLKNGYTRTIHNGQSMAAKLGIRWKDNYVPEHVRKFLTEEHA